MNDRNLSLLVLILVILYAVSPDPCPGPVDDLIVLIMGFVARKKLRA